MGSEDAVWVFGYGSIIWKPNFTYKRRIKGYIVGYVRRFWQRDSVHRGTPDKPGRVATLVKDETACSKVWGLAYLVSKESMKSVLLQLDEREKSYLRVTEDFYPSDYQYDDVSCCPLQVYVYVSSSDDVNYAGPLELDKIAECILLAEERSGRNTEYVFRLADSMRLLAPREQDEHLFSLETKVLDKL